MVHVLMVLVNITVTVPKDTLVHFANPNVMIVKKYNVLVEVNV